MHFTLTFEWNGKLVATAQATAVMAYEFADGFFKDTFAADAFNDWYGKHFINLLDELVHANTHGERREWTFDYQDSTGQAKLLIRC